MILLLCCLLLCFFLLDLLLFLLLERLFPLDFLHQTRDEAVFLLDVISDLVESITSMYGFLSVSGEIGEILVFCEDICLVLELGVVGLVAEPEETAVICVEVSDDVHIGLGISDFYASFVVLQVLDLVFLVEVVDDLHFF